MESTESSQDPILRERALEWYHSRFPHRNRPESEIIELYQQVLDYAQSDPLLKHYYAHNHVIV